MNTQLLFDATTPAAWITLALALLNSLQVVALAYLTQGRRIDTAKLDDLNGKPRN
jgi:hypothetical protein